MPSNPNQVGANALALLKTNERSSNPRKCSVTAALGLKRFKARHVRVDTYRPHGLGLREIALHIRWKVPPALGAGACGTERRTKMIQLKRVYQKAAADDGKRFLIERLWPRGIRKTALRLDAWLKEVGPSTSLRQWFGHDPKKWGDFRRRYFSELDRNGDAWAPILQAARRGRVTLLYSSHDIEHNNAVALKEYLEFKMRGKKSVEIPKQNNAL